MRQAEARAFRNTPSFTLMRRAGEAVARLVEQRFAQTSRIIVACGSGNNGGDGYIAAQKLATRGFSVLVLPLGKSRSLDAARACERCGLPRIGIDELDACIEQAAAEEKIVLIDAMVGIGLTRPLRGTARSVAMRFAQARRDGSAVVLAVDLPSGLFSDSPCVEDGVVVADLTLCFFRKKSAHVLLPSRALCGEIVCEDIGMEEDGSETDIVENEPALFAHAAFCQPLDLQTHKHRRGEVIVVRSQMAGAAVLAAEAATRSGVEHSIPYSQGLCSSAVGRVFVFAFSFDKSRQHIAAAGGGKARRASPSPSPSPNRSRNSSACGVHTTAHLPHPKQDARRCQGTHDAQGLLVRQCAKPVRNSRVLAPCV